MSSHHQISPRVITAQRQRFALPCAGLFAVALTLGACGENRSAQCQKIGDVLNKTSSQMLSASSTSQGFSQGAALAEQAAAELTALDLGDTKLSHLRSHLAAAYRDVAKASTAMDGIAEKDGAVVTGDKTSEGQKQIIDTFTKAGKHFSSLMNATQTYCNGGTVPGEYTDRPAP